MSLKKPSETEEEYFAREEALKHHKAAIEAQREMAASERESLRVQHFMHCPKCGMELKTIHFREVQVDRCFGCHGTWLDQGELERLAGPDRADLLQRIAAVFRPD